MGWPPTVSVPAATDVADAIVVSARPTSLAARSGHAPTNAATGVRPVAAINDMQWPDDHKHLRELAELYLDIPGEAL